MTTSPPVSNPAPIEPPLLLSAADLAHLLSIGTRTVWRLRDAGDLPAPIRLGKLIRWRKAAIERWLAESETTRR